jgi:hypothetical protein
LEDELYSKQDMLAFQLVGEFLCWFSMLETNIDQSVIDLLDLEPVAGRLLMSYVPFQKKCDLLRELFSLEEVGFTNQEKKDANSKLNRIRGRADTRNIIAHSFFSSEEMGVKFLNAEKKMRADISQTIDQEEFRRHQTDMADLWGWLAQITHRIKVTMNRKQLAQALSDRLANELVNLFPKLH